MKNAAGERAVRHHSPEQQADPYYRDYIPFYEYFDGDTGRGLGASHQTGWTALVARLIEDKVSPAARAAGPQPDGREKGDHRHALVQEPQ